MDKRLASEIGSPSSGSTQKRKKQEHQEESERDIVDFVNSLGLEEFKSRYIPQKYLDLSIPAPISPVNNKTEQEPDASTEVKNSTYSVAFYSSSTLPLSRFEACYSLIEYTSSAAYKASSTGWSRRVKTDEMRLLDMRYLLLIRDNSDVDKGQHESPTIAPDGKDNGRRRRGLRTKASGIPHDEVGGFVSFMTTYEDSIPVLYCYELHLHPSLQRRGLGKILVQTIEEIAQQIGGLRKVMLTVFRSNVDGIKFYEKIGYSEDEFSPKPVKTRRGTREQDYLILSKNI